MYMQVQMHANEKITHVYMSPQGFFLLFHVHGGRGGIEVLVLEWEGLKIFACC